MFFFQINNSDNVLHFCNSGMKVNTIHSAVDMPSSNLQNNYDHIWDMSIPYISDFSSSNTSWQCCCNSCILYRLNIFKDRQFNPDKYIKKCNTAVWSSLSPWDLYSRHLVSNKGILQFYPLLLVHETTNDNLYWIII